MEGRPSAGKIATMQAFIGIFLYLSPIIGIFNLYLIVSALCYSMYWLEYEREEEGHCI